MTRNYKPSGAPSGRPPMQGYSKGPLAICQVGLPQAAHDAVMALALERDCSRAQIIRDAVKAYLEARGPLGHAGQGLVGVVGQWPGDETDEEISKELAELS